MIQLFLIVTIAAIVIGVIIFLAFSDDGIVSKQTDLRKTDNSYEESLTRLTIERDKFKWKILPNGFEYYIYPLLKNKMTLMVLKHGQNTQGIGWKVIKSFNKKTGLIKKACPANWDYNSGEDIDTTKQEMDDLYKRLKSCRK